MRMDQGLMQYLVAMATSKRERGAPVSQLEDQPSTHSEPSHGDISWRGRLSYVALGLASLVWLGLRSGIKPSRFVYPCQQVAATNGLSFLAYTLALISSTRAFRHARKNLTLGLIVALILGLALVVLLKGDKSFVSDPTPDNVVVPALVLPAWTGAEAISDVFAVTHVPTSSISLDGGVVPEGVPLAEALHHAGIDALINLMAAQGGHFYKTARQPKGIIGRDDVVVVKVNNQWNCKSYGAQGRRSHTNVDAVKGLVYRIVQHPEGFAGAVIIADNGQRHAKFDCADHNNAEDARQSFQDVTDAFASQGYDVCKFAWDDIRNDIVSEYTSGDIGSGFVLVQDGSPGVDQLSYPKFEVTCGSHTYRISMRHGLWDGVTYTNSRLKLINFPVVKRHGMAGATIAVKNTIGFLTTANMRRRFGGYVTMHDFFWGYEGGSDYGLLGRQLALIRRADLNIVDAIWVNPADHRDARSAVRDNVLLASTDPFAVDYYTSVYVLLPHLIPGSDWALSADARHHGGDFRDLLMVNENRARLEGLTDIIDLDDRLTSQEEQAQFNVFVGDASNVQSEMGLFPVH